MFYIYSNTPLGDEMNRYERDELDEIFGEKAATDLMNGISVFMFGAIHVNAAHAALREATEMLMDA